MIFKKREIGGFKNYSKAKLNKFEDLSIFSLILTIIIRQDYIIYIYMVIKQPKI